MTTEDFRSQAPLPNKEFVALCALLMASTALATDVILPAMLVISGAFSLSNENAIQHMITAYLIPFGVGQLFFGPLADSFGRRKVIMAGMALYVVASIASVFAESYAALLAMRGLAGFGAASGRVAITAVIRDCFAGRHMASVMSLVMMVFMVVPIAAPALGQAILILFNWQSIFLFCAFFGSVLILWIAIRLPETLDPANRRPLQFATTWNAFRLVVSTRAAISYALAMAVFFGCMFGFINTTPQLYLDVYSLGNWFPFAFSVGAGGVSIASLINAKVVQHVGMRRLSHASLMIFCGMSAALIVLTMAYDGLPPISLLVSGTCLLFFCFAFIGPNFNALAMEPLGAHAGMASAVFGFLQMALAATVGAIIGQLYDGTALPMLMGFLLCGLASLGFVLLAERGRLMQAF